MRVRAFLVKSRSRNGATFLNRLRNVHRGVKCRLYGPISIYVRNVFLLEDLPSGLRSAARLDRPRARLLFRVKRRLISIRVQRRGFRYSNFCLQRIRGVDGRLLRRFVIALRGFRRLYLLLIYQYENRRFQRSSGYIRQNASFVTRVHRRRQFKTINVLYLLAYRFRFDFRLFRPNGIVRNGRRTITILGLRVLTKGVDVTFHDSTFTVPGVRGDYRVHRILLRRGNVLCNVPRKTILARVIDTTASYYQRNVIATRGVSRPSDFNELCDSNGVMMVNMRCDRITICRRCVNIRVPRGHPRRLINRFRGVLFW